MSYQDVRHWYEDPPDEQDLKDKEIQACKDILRQECGIRVDDLIEEKKDLRERLDTAIRWLRRLEREYPGCLNPDAIDKHLLSTDEQAEAKRSELTEDHGPFPCICQGFLRVPNCPMHR